MFKYKMGVNITMTNLSVINQFFNERIRVVDGRTKPLLQKLKSVCEARASGRISEEKALFELSKITNSKTNYNPLLKNLRKGRSINPLIGVKSIHKEPVLNKFNDFGNVAKRDQFPVFGLKPVPSNGGKKKFIVSPMARSWFDVTDFRKAKPVFEAKKDYDNGLVGDLKSKVVKTRLDSNSVIMNRLKSTAKKNMGVQPVFNDFKNSKYSLGNSRFGGKKKSVVNLMGLKK